MQIHVKLVVIAVILVASTESKPSWPNLFVPNFEEYKEPPESINLQPQVLQYHNVYSPYYCYNMQTDLNDVPPLFPSEKTTFSHFPTHNVYFGTPLFNIRASLPENGGKESPTTKKPNNETPLTTTTMKPDEGTESSTENMGTTPEPAMKTQDPCLISDNAGKDSITIGAI